MARNVSYTEIRQLLIPLIEQMMQNKNNSPHEVKLIIPHGNSILGYSNDNNSDDDDDDDDDEYDDSFFRTRASSLSTSFN
jgi:hypothetical protein